MRSDMGWLVATLILTAILALRTHSQTVDWRQPVAIDGIQLGDTYDDVVPGPRPF